MDKRILSGSLWNIFKLTNDSTYFELAKRWTALMEKEKFNGGTHDMGFKIMCSFGLEYEHTKSPKSAAVILESAKTLATRFNPTVGCIRSWDFNKDIWEFPVIIDNMMNLELLCMATQISGDSTYHNMAVSHANTTLKHHFRDNNSSVHVVVYDTISGQPLQKVTHQGISDDSSWARGQTWGLYGYTMMYRFTKDEKYIDQAKKIATFFFNHKNLPEDLIPYWDFDAPNIPNEPKDASAAAVAASALYELYEYTKEQTYLEKANSIVETLNSESYLIDKETTIPFILKHSTGNMPAEDEINEPISYADYYFLEALNRKEHLNL